MKIRLKKGDTVKVITGKDKGKTGTILSVNREVGKVVVQGVNMLTKHQKPNAKNPQGGIVHVEGAIHASNVMLLDPKTNQPTRIAVKEVVETKDGKEKVKRVRVAKKSGEMID